MCLPRHVLHCVSPLLLLVLLLLMPSLLPLTSHERILQEAPAPGRARPNVMRARAPACLCTSVCTSISSASLVLARAGQSATHRASVLAHQRVCTSVCVRVW
jgi:hypothetical protein